MLYPIAIEVGSDSEAYGVVFPDVEGCFSAGDTLEEALENAKEALEAHFELLAESGEVPTMPTSLSQHQKDPEYTGWTWGVIDINLDPFMGKASKINVTLPTLLMKKIDDVVEKSPHYQSRSHFLQVSAMKELEVSL